MRQWPVSSAFTGSVSSSRAPPCCWPNGVRRCAPASSWRAVAERAHDPRRRPAPTLPRERLRRGEHVPVVGERRRLGAVDMLEVMKPRRGGIRERRAPVGARLRERRLVRGDRARHCHDGGALLQDVIRNPPAPPAPLAIRTALHPRWPQPLLHLPTGRVTPLGEVDRSSGALDDQHRSLHERASYAGPRTDRGYQMGTNPASPNWPNRTQTALQSRIPT